MSAQLKPAHVPAAEDTSLNQGLVRLSLGCPGPSDIRSSVISHCRLETTKNRGRFRGVRYVLLRRNACAHANGSPRNRTHTQPESTSPVTETSPQLRPQNHMPPRLHFDVPTSYRARLVSLRSSLSLASKAALSTPRAQSNNAFRCRWRTALAEGQRLGSRAPAAQRARTPAVTRRPWPGATDLQDRLALRLEVLDRAMRRAHRTRQPKTSRAGARSGPRATRRPRAAAGDKA